MTENWYVLDSNVLSRLTLEERSSAFVREHCRIPSEVLHEVDGFPDIVNLRKLEYRVTPNVLECVREVMNMVAPGDFKLVDLYRNKGGADPLLIATAIVQIRRSEETLFLENWRIVTEDVAVRETAAKTGRQFADHAGLHRAFRWQLRALRPSPLSDQAPAYLAQHSVGYSSTEYLGDSSIVLVDEDSYFLLGAGKSQVEQRKQACSFVAGY
jgi:hypothetical protein